jgi:hypothetical protein
LEVYFLPQQPGLGLTKNNIFDFLVLFACIWASPSKSICKYRKPIKGNQTLFPLIKKISLEIRGTLYKFKAAVGSRHRSVQEHQQMLNQSHYFGRLMISSAVERNGFLFYTYKMFEIDGHLLESPSYLSPFHFPPKLRQQHCLKTLCV